MTSPSEFERLLRDGDERLGGLDEIQWMHLNWIAECFSQDWQSWFTRQEYPAIFRQRDSRAWSASQQPLTADDFQDDNLIVQLWTAWDAASRLFDEQFKTIAVSYANRVTVRSLNANWQHLLKEVLIEDRFPCPALLLYSRGKFKSRFDVPDLEVVFQPQLCAWLDLHVAASRP